ncbi:MAG: type II toxin-antitoxin system VapC family toxin [Acidimicrobiia bacterium]
MIVLDASVLIPALLDYHPESTSTKERLMEWRDHSYGAPHLVDLEVAHTLRRIARAKRISEHTAAGALSDLMGMALQRFPHHPFLGRVWELRHNLTAYDAAYLALAETLEVPLVTRDRGMAIADTTAEVVVIS